MQPSCPSPPAGRGGAAGTATMEPAQPATRANEWVTVAVGPAIPLYMRLQRSLSRTPAASEVSLRAGGRYHGGAGCFSGDSGHCGR